MTARLGWCCFVSATLAAGCGGATRKEVELPGPPHEGYGLYELSIERVRDDCKPPLVDGTIGPVVVVVRSPSANIPLYEVTPSAPFAPARSDVSFEKAISYVAPIGTLTECDASMQIDVSVPIANAERIDVRYQRTLVEVSACPPDGQAEDCSSERIFHFRWLHACQESRDLTECVEP